MLKFLLFIILVLREGGGKKNLLYYLCVIYFFPLLSNKLILFFIAYPCSPPTQARRGLGRGTSCCPHTHTHIHLPQNNALAPQSCNQHKQNSLPKPKAKSSPWGPQSQQTPFNPSVSFPMPGSACPQPTMTERKIKGGGGRKISKETWKERRK